MRAHQPGSTPIDIPETVPNPAHTPAPAPAPERAPTKAPNKVHEKVIAPASFDAGGPGFKLALLAVIAITLLAGVAFVLMAATFHDPPNALQTKAFDTSIALVCAGMGAGTEAWAMSRA
jgi:hypothetical protein